MHGTVELQTENLILRRYRPGDAEDLYRRFGTDPEMVKYSGWNPYATPEMARESVRGFIESYADEHSYSWVMDVDNVVVGTIGAYDYVHDIGTIGAYDYEQDVGTIGAYDYEQDVGTIGVYDYQNDQIEVGFSVDKRWQGRGFATEALKKVLAYLTENEGISRVMAWCAAENIGSQRVLEKTGMRLVRTEKDGLRVGGIVYDKLIYEYKPGMYKPGK